MEQLQEVVAVLSRTPDVLDALLRGLPESLTLRGEGENTWSAFEVIGHLNHCEIADWMPRAKMILEHGESSTFEPLDRWAQQRESAGKSLDQLLDEFALLRAENLRELRGLNLGKRELELRGTHPAFGAVTLLQLLSAWGVHDLTHLHQISRILASQKRESVGPWVSFLGVLQCNGHSS